MSVRPKSHPLLGDLPSYTRDPLGFTLSAARAGDVTPVRFGSYRSVHISHPDAIERVLVTDHRNFIKGPALQRSKLLFGNGLLTSEGDFWRRQRKLIQPAFHRERIAAYALTMVELTERHIAGWRHGQTSFDIHAEMMRLTMQIAVRTLFGTEATQMDRVAHALELAQANFGRWIPYVIMLPPWCPTPSTPALNRAVRDLDAVVYKMIADRRASGEDRGDLLSLLLRLQDEEDGAFMTDRQLRDEVLTLFLAGHDTTALALTWTWYLLAQHPEVEAKLHAELDTVLAGRPPTLADRPCLKFTEQVMLESMRLYPPAWIVGRQALSDYEIDGYRIPAGTAVVASQYAVHRDPRWFPAPETFDPDRWADDFAKTLPRYAYFPFGGGPRICIGNTFAQMEGLLLLATIAQHYRFRLVPTHRVVPQPSVTLRPANGVQVTIECR
jgi:cytochrome P450